MIAREYLDWLAVVTDLPESELPCNQSTVAYAVRCARLLRDENERLHRIILDMSHDNARGGP